MSYKPTYEELEKRLQTYERELVTTQNKLKKETKLHNQLSSGVGAFLNLLDNLPAFIALQNENRSLTFASNYCRSLFGDPSGKKCYEYFLQKDEPCEKCMLCDPSQPSSPMKKEMELQSGTKFLRLSTLCFSNHLGEKFLLRMGIDISGQKRTEHILLKEKEELELRVEERTNELQRKNIALTEVLSQLEIEKKNLATKVGVNVQKLLLPVIDKLIEKSSSLDSRYLMMIRQNLESLTSSIGIKLSSTEYNLTPKEMELCVLIKGGFSIKEIAAMQNLSERTVETHRLNIRKKLGINSSKINLSSYLAQL